MLGAKSGDVPDYGVDARRVLATRGAASLVLADAVFAGGGGCPEQRSGGNWYMVRVGGLM